MRSVLLVLSLCIAGIAQTAELTINNQLIKFPGPAQEIDWSFPGLITINGCDLYLFEAGSVTPDPTNEYCYGFTVRALTRATISNADNL
ncbi:hypothetical protein KC906_02805 [Candidatus Kaiserbacteria bacterium]|nr:hypothetical protein [Candidatus Kaiserbacteria bacterium]MCB9812700.1 hypothetical protein [Candidatus Nomurabacteria bacterium]